MEVGLPVDRIILIRPGHMPDGDTGHGDGGEAVGAGPQAELGIIPLDEERQGLADGVRDQARNEAHPPAVVVHIDAAVQVRSFLPAGVG